MCFVWLNVGREIGALLCGNNRFDAFPIQVQTHCEYLGRSRYLWTTVFREIELPPSNRSMTLRSECEGMNAFWGTMSPPDTSYLYLSSSVVRCAHPTPQGDTEIL